MTQVVHERDPKEGVYRLERFDVEVKGRWREFRRSVLLFLLLLLILRALRIDALKSPATSPDIDPVVSLRISLIIEVAFMISYVLATYRAWGLVRTFRAPRRLAATARLIAYYVVPILVVVDIGENIYLWQAFTGEDEVTRLGWGPSHSILVVGVGVAFCANVLLALVTDPRLHWRR